jgi:hypothetical protein
MSQQPQEHDNNGRHVRSRTRPARKLSRHFLCRHDGASRTDPVNRRSGNCRRLIGGSFAVHSRRRGRGFRGSRVLLRPEDLAPPRRGSRRVEPSRPHRLLPDDLDIASAAGHRDGTKCARRRLRGLEHRRCGTGHAVSQRRGQLDRPPDVSGHPPFAGLVHSGRGQCAGAAGRRPFRCDRTLVAVLLGRAVVLGCAADTCHEPADLPRTPSRAADADAGDPDRPAGGRLCRLGATDRRGRRLRAGAAQFRLRLCPHRADPGATVLPSSVCTVLVGTDLSPSRHSPWPRSSSPTKPALPGIA